jgi:hypothetical protein
MGPDGLVGVCAASGAATSTPPKINRPRKTRMIETQLQNQDTAFSGVAAKSEAGN